MQKSILVLVLVICSGAVASPIKGSIFTFTPWTAYNPPLVFEFDAATDSQVASFNVTGACPEGNQYPGILFDPQGIYDPVSNELLILNMILVNDQPHSFWVTMDLASGSIKCAQNAWGSKYAYLRWMQFDAKSGLIYGVVQNPSPFFANFAIVDPSSGFSVSEFAPLNLPGNASAFTATTAYDPSSWIFYAVLFSPVQQQNEYLFAVSTKTGKITSYPIQDAIVYGITVEPGTGRILALATPHPTAVNSTLGELIPSSDGKSYVFSSLPSADPLEIFDVGGGQLFVDGNQVFVFAEGGNCGGMLCQWLIFYDIHTGQVLKVEDAAVYMGNDNVGNGNLGPHAWVPAK